MKTSTLKTIAVFTAVSLVASVSVAKNGKGGNGGSSNHRSSHGSISAFKIGGGNGGGNNKHTNKSSNNSDTARKVAGAIIATKLLHNINNNANHGNHGDNGQCQNDNDDNDNDNDDDDNDDDNQVSDQGNLSQSNLGRSFEPTHSSYIVLPGDTLFEVSLKEYGTSANAKFISQFNNLGQNPALVVGQTLQIPAISVNGQLSVSRSPAAESLQSSPVTNNLSTAGNFASTATAAPATTTTAPAVSAPLPKVPVGSTLLVDGQSFGDKQGAARLRVGGAALKIEVVEWAGSSVKIRLPQLDLASSMTADIEVVRADGSLASKTGIELNAPTEVALAK